MPIIRDEDEVSRGILREDVHHVKDAETEMNVRK